MQVGFTVLDARMISEVVAGDVIGMRVRGCLGGDGKLRVGEMIHEGLEDLRCET
jgi:hypothetical protein